MGRARISLAFTALAFAGCVDTGNDGPTLFAAEPELVATIAVLSAPETAAGVAVQVTCRGKWDNDKEDVLPAGLATVKVSPAAGATIDGASLTVPRAGTYEVTCAVDDVDATPATLTVRAADAARIVATLDRTRIPVGESAHVTCTVEDAQGNPRSGDQPTVESSSLNGAPVSGLDVRGGIPGEYTVRCLLGRLSSDLVPIRVIPGTPVVLRAALDRYEVRAGEHVTVHCLAEDVGGNPVTVQADVRVDVSPYATDATGLTPGRAEPHHITCALPSAMLESAPVELIVRPGLPAEMTVVDVAPARMIYGRNEVVELNVEIRDAYANVVPAANVEVSATPFTSATPAGPRRVTLLGDGPIPLTARVTSPTHEGRAVEATVTINVDGRPPEIVITYPSRAQIVAAMPGQTLTVRGTVTDASTAVTSLNVNGQNVTIGRGGAFSTTMVPTWGINVIEATAVDDVGNTRALSQSYELASSYRRAGANRIATGRVPDGLMLHIGRAALDDNNADVDDLATIARLAVERVNLSSLIPSPVTNFHSDCSIPFVSITGNLRLYVDRVTYASPSFDFTPIQGGLRLRVEVNNVNVNLHTSGDVCEIGMGLSGSARANRIVVTADLMVSASSGRAAVRIASQNVQISGLSINLNLPSIIDWAVDGIINLFSGAIANELESAFGDVIASEVPPVIEDFIESVQVGTSFALPAPLNLTLGVDARLGSILFDANGGNTGQDTTIYTTGVISPEPLGAILQEGRQAAAFDATRALGVGISYDLVNQALYSLWYGGGIDFDLDPSLFPSQMGNGATASAHLEAMLPLIVRPSGDPAFPLELQGGELKFEVDLTGVGSLPPIRATLYAAFFARASVSVDAQGQIQIALAPNVDVSIDFDSSIEGVLDLVGFTATLESTLSTLIPQLVGQVLRGIPLPNFDLSQMAGNYLPPGIVLGVGQPAIRVQPSYLVLEGNVVRIP